MSFNKVSIIGHRCERTNMDAKFEIYITAVKTL